MSQCACSDKIKPLIRETNAAGEMSIIVFKDITRLKRHLTNRITHNTMQGKYARTRVYNPKCNDCPKFHIGARGISQNTINSTHNITQPLIKSNFVEHIFNSNHMYTNLETNLKILHTLSKVIK